MTMLHLSPRSRSCPPPAPLWQRSPIVSTCALASCAMLILTAGCNRGGLGAGQDERSGAAQINTDVSHPPSLGPTAMDAVSAAQKARSEGPAAFTARTGSCRKPQLATLLEVLAGWGVNMSGSVRTVLDRYEVALGAAEPAAFRRELQQMTTVTAGLTYDLFIAACPEIIANATAHPRCATGQPVTLFDAGGRCTEDGLTCLIGRPATADQAALCSQFAAQGSSPERGQCIAIASLLAAEFTCE